MTAFRVGDKHGVVGHVLRKQMLPPLADLHQKPRQGPGQLPALPAAARQSTTFNQFALSYLNNQQLSQDYGLGNVGFTLGQLAQDGCLSRPDDVHTAMLGYEQVIAKLAGQLSLLTNVKRVLDAPAKDLAAAAALLRDDGTAPEQFFVARRGEAGASTTERKRQTARAFRMGEAAHGRGCVAHPHQRKTDQQKHIVVSCAVNIIIDSLKYV